MTQRTFLKLLLHVGNFGLAAQGVPAFGGTDLLVDMMARGERPLPGDAERLAAAAERLAGEHAGAWGDETVTRAVDLVRTAPLDPDLVASAFARGDDAGSAAALLLNDLHLRLDARGEDAELDIATANLLRQIFRDLYADDGALHALAATTLQQVAHRVATLNAAIAAGNAPPLTLPRAAEKGDPLRYWNRRLPVLGRDAEAARLRAFLDAEGGIRWLQLAGGAGQGKSRLALELCLERAGAWDVGLLPSQALARFDRWHLWQPTAPTLIVLDYLTGWEGQVRETLTALLRRRFKQPLRLLLVERTPHRGAAGERGAGGDDTAPWWHTLVGGYGELEDALADTRFEDGVIELRALGEDELVAIVRRRLEGRAAAPPADEILATLARLDDAGRPLYAYLLAEHLAAGDAAPDTRERLLDRALEREQRRFWHDEGRHLPAVVADDPAMRLAVLATLVRGVPAGAAIAAVAPDLADAGAQERIAEACRINGHPVLPEQVKAATIIPPLQPDLLGEYLILKALPPRTALAAGSEDAATAEAVALLRAAWRLAPEGTAQALVLAAQDFPHHAHLPPLLAILPEEPAGAAALAIALAQITAHAADAAALPLAQAAIVAVPELRARFSGDQRGPRLALTVAAYNAALIYGMLREFAAMERARGELDASLAGFENDREFRLRRVRAATNAAADYGKAGDRDAMECARGELDASLGGFEDDREFRLQRVGAAYNAALAYGIVRDFAEMEHGRAELDAALGGFEDDREFRLQRVMAASNAALDYGNAGELAAMERARGELHAALDGFEDDREFRLTRVQAAYNAALAYAQAVRRDAVAQALADLDAAAAGLADDPEFAAVLDAVARLR